MQERWLSITEKKGKDDTQTEGNACPFTPERNEPTSEFFILCDLCNLDVFLIKLHIGFSSADLPSIAIHNSGKL